MRNRTLGFCVPMLYHWATEILVRKSPKKVYIWHAYCILLGSTIPMASCSVNRISKMVCFFKLGKEIDSGEQGPSQSSFMTRVLHTAGISNTRASERGIRRSEVRFPTGTQNFFFVPRLWQNEKHLSLFLYRAKNFLKAHLSYFIYNKYLLQARPWFIGANIVDLFSFKHQYLYKHLRSPC